METQSLLLQRSREGKSRDSCLRCPLSCRVAGGVACRTCVPVTFDVRCVQMNFVLCKCLLPAYTRYTALHLAALDPSTPIVIVQTLAEYYRETGALEIQDSDGLTALDLAAQRGVDAWAVVDVLINVGAVASATALEVHASEREELHDAQ